jgi:hypothetical protein
MIIDIPYKFTLREYQIEPWNKVMDPSFERGLLVVPRRNGKDILCWNALVAKATQRTGLYYYVAPYYNQVRQIIWEGFDYSGRRFLDYIPPELIANKTKIDMRIDLVNGSQIKLQGSDEVDRIIGTNPFGIVMTEFSLQKPAAWNYLRPVLAENGGWALFNGTPRGENHMFDLYKNFLSIKNYYVQFLTRDDTGIPSLEAIEQDRQSGMPEELIQQEYYCSFTSGVVGSYFADKLSIMRKEGMIGDYPYDPALPVHTWWDLGVQKSGNAIWFIQIHGLLIHVIDFYENQEPKVGLPTYIKALQDRPYIYGTHVGPHDIETTEWGSGRTRREAAYDLGVDFIVVPRGPVEDGIEMVRFVLPRCRFNYTTTAVGVQHLAQYRMKRDEKNKAFTTPNKDDSAHATDSFRIGSTAIMADMIDNSFGHTEFKHKVLTSTNSPVFNAFDNLRLIQPYMGVPRFTPPTLRGQHEIH